MPRASYCRSPTRRILSSTAATCRHYHTGCAAMDLRRCCRWRPRSSCCDGRNVLAVGCNLVNNLPAGLLAGRVVQLAEVPEAMRSAVLIGVDLGPNLSVTGSLATILWLTALRREGLRVGAWQFLTLGALVMPPAL